MTAVSVRGADVVRCTITLPLRGVWCADVDVDTSEAITGAASIEVDGGPTWVGTVLSGAVSHGLWRGRIIGGAGGLRTSIPARAYQNATAADLIGDALTETRERLAASSSTLGAAFARWHRLEAPASSLVARVAESLGYG